MTVSPPRPARHSAAAAALSGRAAAADGRSSRAARPRAEPPAEPEAAPAAPVLRTAAPPTGPRPISELADQLRGAAEVDDADDALLGQRRGRGSRRRRPGTPTSAPRCCGVRCTWAR